MPQFAPSKLFRAADASLELAFEPQQLFLEEIADLGDLLLDLRELRKRQQVFIFFPGPWKTAAPPPTRPVHYPPGG
jgi:hypothetical protein